MMHPRDVEDLNLLSELLSRSKRRVLLVDRHIIVLGRTVLLHALDVQADVVAWVGPSWGDPPVMGMRPAELIGRS